MSSISFIYGLGNPGERYRRTRHNLGWMVVDRVRSECRVGWTRVGEELLRADCNLASVDITLLRSTLYMNNSGEALYALRDFDPSSMLVVCDDINLPLGKIRIRMRGGSGGHRGLESIIVSLGTEDFPRMRLGIGSPPEGISWTEYVLSEFLEEEAAVVEEMVESAVEAVRVVAEEGLEAAMQIFNAGRAGHGGAGD